MIDIHREKLYRPDAPEVLRHPAFPQGVHPCTVWRYINRGAKRGDGTYVKLQAVRLPSGVHVSLEAVDRMVDALNGSTPPTADSDRGHEQAVDELARAGIA